MYYGMKAYKIKPCKIHAAQIFVAGHIFFVGLIVFVFLSDAFRLHLAPIFYLTGIKGDGADHGVAPSSLAMGHTMTAPSTKVSSVTTKLLSRPARTGITAGLLALVLVGALPQTSMARPFGNAAAWAAPEASLIENVQYAPRHHRRPVRRNNDAALAFGLIGAALIGTAIIANSHQRQTYYDNRRARYYEDPHARYYEDPRYGGVGAPSYYEADPYEDPYYRPLPVQRRPIVDPYNRYTRHGVKIPRGYDPSGGGR